MKPFCEIIVQDVLPGIRAIVAKELMEKHKMTQTDVAKKLGVTQGAVSQYKRDLRGYRVKMLSKNKDVMKGIENLAAKIATGELKDVNAMNEVCSVCSLIRKKKLICEKHSCSAGLEGCNVCMKGKTC